MNPARAGRILSSWKALKAATGIGLISSEEDYAALVSLVDYLVDVDAIEESHALYDLFRIACNEIERHDNLHSTIENVSGVEALRFLIEQHELKQSDLAPLFGSQSVVSEVLRGKRALNRGHIESLSIRFGVSPSLFFDGSVGSSSKSRVTITETRSLAETRPRNPTGRKSVSKPLRKMPLRKSNDETLTKAPSQAKSKSSSVGLRPRKTS